MKALLYGSSLVVSYFKPLLIDSGIEVIPVTAESIEGPAPEVNRYMHDINIVFVDAVEKYPGAALKHFTSFPEVPVVMLINGKFSNWDDLLQNKIQGYISISGTIKVVYSRLQTILRRIG